MSCAVSSTRLVITIVKTWDARAAEMGHFSSFSAPNRAVLTPVPVRSQVSSSQCTAFDQPSVSRACGSTPCSVAAPNVSIVYAPWTLCDSPCGSGAGYADRSASCVSVQGWLTGVDECPEYSGAHVESVVVRA